MSYSDGWAAINLDMPRRVPRTEYSVEGHWKLIEKVTGIHVGIESPVEIKRKAQQAFRKKWDFDFSWSILLHTQAFGDFRTDMGHAEYAAGGIDKRETLYCPFNDPEEVLSFDPMEKYGIIDKKAWTDKFEQHYRQNKDFLPDEVTMTGIYVTCISGLIEIFGWEMMLMAAGIDPQKFGEVANRYCKWVQQFFDALSETTCPIVMIHDDIVWTSGPFIAPEWYREYVFPNYKKLFAPLIDSGKKIAYTSDGTYTMFVDDIASTGVHGFVMEPTTDMKYVADKYGKTHFFIGNADCRILLSGSKQDIEAEVRRCMDIGKKCPGFFMAVGNHIPANPPVENALYYNEIYEKLASR